MKEMIANFAKRFTVKAAICNMHAVSWHGKGNTGLRPEDKFDHELHGMEIALDALGIDYSYEYTQLNGVTIIDSVTILGQKFRVA